MANLTVVDADIDKHLSKKYFVENILFIYKILNLI